MKMTIFVSININNELLIKLEQIGKVILVPELEKTYASINTHPDIQMTIINNQLFIDGDTWMNLTSAELNIDQLKQLKPTIITSNLGNRYPLSVPFNGKFLDNTWVHHLEYTDKTILKFLQEKQIELVHTNQGYTGCSLLLLPNKMGITSDIGLSKTLMDKGYEMLLIQEGHINLDGLSHGFIGGCCGYYNQIVYINGDLSLHPDGDEIRRFICKQEIRIDEIEDYPLTDIGSILFYEGENDA